jgi:hypothetical protein
MPTSIVEMDKKLFLVTFLGLARVLFCDHAFLIMGIVNVTMMPTTNETTNDSTLLSEQG